MTAAERKAWLAQATRLFVAAFGALVVAHALGLSHPFWAAMPVWVVAQVYRQDLLTRAVLRLVGTGIGAGVGLAALTYVHHPAVLVLVLAAASAIAVFTAFWIGTVYSYGALMAAITIGVVVLPAMGGSVDLFPLAVDRVWCTLIGVCAVTLTTFAFTPPRAEQVPLRIDHGAGRALRRALVAFVCVALAVTLVSWDNTHFALIAFALTLCVFSAVLGGMPDPTPALRFLLPGALIGVIAGIVFRTILTVTGLEGAGMLALAGVFIAAGALLRTNKKTAPFGLDSNMCFLLSAEVGTVGRGLELEVMGGIALLLGATLVSGFYRIALKRPSWGF